MQDQLIVAQQGPAGIGWPGGSFGNTSRGWSSGSRGRSGEADAARFLIQASFGPSEASIASVMSRGVSGWLEQQFATPQTLHRTYIEQAIAAGDPATPQSAYRDFVMDTFWKQAITGEDQLRQRMAFALSQIFVVSQVNGDVGSRPRGLASYLDMLGAHAFGNFRKLLEAVTLHPVMGLYLSHLRNQKENPATGRVPDENFARELMQLFTIGLYELNPDGSQRLDGRGRPIPTYDNADVQGLAKVFTGWSWAGPDKSNTRFFGGTPDPDRDILPMHAYPQYHSTSPKAFLDVSIPANTPAEASLKTALDGLFNHPNTGPFIARQLIQRFVTSNPSPAYVARVAAAFAGGGWGRVRGDMKAVIRAMLLDTEARSDRSLTQATWGKLREPVVRLANWARAFGATSVSGNFTIRNVADPSTALGQNPLRSPSVFNFYRPGYVPPNTAIAAAGLVAPEFQITGENSTAGYLNFMRNVVNTGAGSGADVRSSYLKEVALAGNPDQLVDRVRLLLTANRMTDATRLAIRDAVSSIPVTAANATLNRAKLAVYLTLASSEFVAQK
jgi:uncharacterized protein (DUF1800 family)